MTKCIGCKCCVVACNEQNGNPAELNWRRVGEVEGGYYPHTQRHYLSMGCNHCVEPSCLIGCPVEAYTKDPVTGVVMHSAEACIGCQYCTWNCSYGVPQYNPDARRCRQVRHVPQPVERRYGSGVRGGVSGGRDRDRDREHRGVAARLSFGQRTGTSFGGRQHFNDSRDAARESGARPGARGYEPRGTGAPALAAGVHAGADAVVRWSVYGALAARVSTARERI